MLSRLAVGVRVDGGGLGDLMRHNGRSTGGKETRMRHATGC